MYIAMLLLVTFALPSCEVDLSLGNHTLEYRERTAYLCSSDWQDDCHQLCQPGIAYGQVGDIRCP